MSCRCENKKRMSELERVSELARKAAILEQRVMAIHQRADGSYTFDSDTHKEDIVELRHYL